MEIILDSPAMAFHFLQISTSPMQKWQMTTKFGHRNRPHPVEDTAASTAEGTGRVEVKTHKGEWMGEQLTVDRKQTLCVILIADTVCNSHRASTGQL